MSTKVATQVQETSAVANEAKHSSMDSVKSAAHYAARSVTQVVASVPESYRPLVAGAAAGAAAVPIVGVAAGAMVPTAMSYFGTIVPGVGTIHAAGGVAATLQWASCAFLSTSAAAVGSTVGVATAAVTRPASTTMTNQHECSTGQPTSRL